MTEKLNSTEETEEPVLDPNTVMNWVFPIHIRCTIFIKRIIVGKNYTKMLSPVWWNLAAKKIISTNAKMQKNYCPWK